MKLNSINSTFSCCDGEAVLGKTKQKKKNNISLKAAKAPVGSNIISSLVNLIYYVNKKECYATVCQTVLFSFSHPQEKKQHWNISAKLHWTKTVQLLSSLTEPMWQKCKIIFIENSVWIKHFFLIFHRRKQNNQLLNMWLPPFVIVLWLHPQNETLA